MKTVHYCCLCLLVLSTGCQSLRSLASKPKETPAADQLKAASGGGSSEPEIPPKPVDPIKLHLAYAAWHEQSGNYKEAHESYKKVLDKDRKNLEAMLGLARIDRAYGRDAEADQQLKKALKQHPKDPKVYVALGQVYSERHEDSQAIEMMRKACELAPYDLVYEYHLAVTEAHAGDVKAALEHFGRSVGQAEGHFNLAVILNEQGNRSDAESHLIKALQLKPELKQAQAALASLRAGEPSDIQPASFNKKSPPAASAR